MCPVALHNTTPPFMMQSQSILLKGGGGGGNNNRTKNHAHACKQDVSLFSLLICVPLQRNVLLEHHIISACSCNTLSPKF